MRFFGHTHRYAIFDLRGVMIRAYLQPIWARHPMIWVVFPTKENIVSYSCPEQECGLERLGYCVGETSFDGPGDVAYPPVFVIEQSTYTSNGIILALGSDL